MTTTAYTKSSTSGKSASPLRVLLYARVSSPQQAQHGHSIESQPEALRAYSKAQGWHVVGEVADAGKTGKNADREGFRALLEAIRASRPDAVVVTRLSRFMRNARLTLNAVHEMRELGVALMCKDEPIDTRQRGIGDLFLAILATMAEWESERLGEYARDTRQNLISKGRWPAGKPPFGYAYDKATGKLVIEPAQAEVVRLIYDLYVNQNLGMERLRRELGARAISAPFGGRVWSIDTIWRILAESVYVGKHRIGIPAPAIVSKSDFQRAQLLRSTNSRLHPPRVDPWPLQNRVRCLLCGSPLKCSYNRGRARVYRCRGRHKAESHYLQTGQTCTLQGLPAERLEGIVYLQLSDMISDPANFSKALEKSISELKRKVVDLSREVAPLEESLRDVEGQLARLEVARIRGRIPESKLELVERNLLDEEKYLKSRLESFDLGRLAELEETRVLLREAEEMLKEGRGSPILTEVVLSGRENAPLAAGRLTPRERADILTKLIDNLRAEIWVGPDHVEVRGLIDLEIPKGDAQATDSVSTHEPTPPPS